MDDFYENKEEKEEKLGIEENLPKHTIHRGNTLQVKLSLKTTVRFKVHVNKFMKRRKKRHKSLRR